MNSPYITRSSRVAYQNRWLRVREDVIVHADGTDGLYGVVERSDFVVVVPWHDGKITLVQQYRYPVSQRVWEFPMGTWNHAPGIDLLVLAAGELREETGLIAGRMLPVGDIFQGPGHCNQRGRVFLATDLVQGETDRESSELDMISQAFPLLEFEDMVRNGVVQESMTLAAFAMLRLKSLI